MRYLPAPASPLTALLLVRGSAKGAAASRSVLTPFSPHRRLCRGSKRYPLQFRGSHLDLPTLPPMACFLLFAFLFLGTERLKRLSSGCWIYGRAKVVQCWLPVGAECLAGHRETERQIGILRDDSLRDGCWYWTFTSCVFFFALFS